MALWTHRQPQETAQPEQPEQPSAHYNRFLVYFAAGVTAIGGLLFGFDTGVISGAQLFLTKDFALNSVTEEIAVSAVLLGAIFGSAIAGKLSDAFGRKIIILTVAAIFAVFAILTALSPNVWVFVVFRIIVGFALGMDAVVAPVYISEISPHKLRGGLVTLNQFLLTIGIAVAYWIDLAFAHANMGWRPMFAVAAIPSSIHFIIMLFLPDTPRWYASKGRWDKARQVLQRFVGDKKDEELKSIRETIEATKHSSVRELFQPGLRTALIVGVGLAIFQQFVGINTIIYYAPTIFGYAGFKSASGAILATSVVGVVNVLSTLLVIFLVDRVGRRPLLFIGLVGMFVALVAMGLIFMFGPAQVGFLILAVLILYIIAFAISLGPVYWLMSSEIFPNRLRGRGSSFAAASNWTANLLVSITFLSLIGAIGKSFTFWLYALLAIAAFIFCWIFVPETKGKRLEQIELYWKNGRHWDEEEAKENRNEGQGS